MSHFYYQDGRLYAEQVEVAEIAALYGTPCYVYSRAAIEQRWQAFRQAFADYPHLICYAVKANSNLAVLNILARLGAGFDIVSGGELSRVIAAGGDPGKIVFSGVGKGRIEIEQALSANIYCFNVESAAELYRIDEIAKTMGKIAPIALRVNPNVDAGTHPYIATGLKENKFGIAMEDALTLYQQAKDLTHIKLMGLGFHIGSQLQELAPIEIALKTVCNLYSVLKQRGIVLNHLDIGGGLGVRYQDERPPSPEIYVQTLLPWIKAQGAQAIIEPGRAIVAEAGILVTRVEYLKPTPAKRFAIVDAAMNDLLRPALYDAWQDIVPLQIRPDGQVRIYDVVGPICESADFLGKQRSLAIEPGDLLAIKSVGAYGFSMSSNYNSRAKAVEVMVDGNKIHQIRERESIAELYKTESTLP